jgi:four helix bundle protein
MNMTPDEMKKRLRTFALRCVKLALSFRKNAAGSVVSYQLIKSSTSAAANYRAACRGKSRADFIAKMKIVEEELDESDFWIGFATECGLVVQSLVNDLLREASELTAIVVASLHTARGREAPVSAVKPPISPRPSSANPQL